MSLWISPASFSFKKSKLGIRNSNLGCFPLSTFVFRVSVFLNFGCAVWFLAFESVFSSLQLPAYDFLVV